MRSSSPVTPIAIVLVNWNGARETIACLETLLRLDTPNIGIFICDNASTDGSLDQLRAWAAERLPGPNTADLADGRRPLRLRDVAAGEAAETSSIGTVTLLRMGRNLGYAGGTNTGLRAALAESYDYFWVLNNDTEVRPDSLDWLLRRMAADASIGICGSTLLYRDRPDLVQCRAGGRFSPLKAWSVPIGFQRPASEPADADAVEAALSYVNGASALVSRAFIEQVGLMAEDYFLYWEELDWALRARGRFRLGYAPRSVVLHKVGASIGTSDFGAGSLLSDYYFARNRLKLANRFARRGLPFAILDTLRLAFRHACRGDRQRAGVVLRALLGRPFPAGG